MLKWLGVNKKKQKEDEIFDSVRSGLQSMYKQRLLPLERDFKANQFYAPLLTDGDFASKPMVMLLGQYSTGKTTFIKHFLEREYPGLRIGPEPTTDRFIAVMDGAHDQVIPGNAAVVDPTKAFSQLSNFGNNFLARFEVSVMPSPALKGITLIDTPGVLSGNKQTSRGYDFEGVIKWFGDQSDLILLIFDAHKLDISDEFRRCIQALRGNDTKIRILLNKADMVNTQQLMRVYGALMWSLGKVIPTPEVARVYIGSFWDQPLQNDENRKLFEAEANDLYTDIQLLPRNAAVRKLNDFIKRARLAKTHCYLLSYLRKQMPSVFGKQQKQKQLIQNLDGVYRALAQEHSLPLGDFPPIQLVQDKLAQFDFSKLPKLDHKRIELLDEMLSHQIPNLMKLIPAEERQTEEALPESVMHAAEPSPFQILKQQGGPAAPGYELDRWLRTPPNTGEFEADFVALGPDHQGRITGAQAKDDLTRSKLPSTVLHKIWNLADVTRDGYLDIYEYALCRHFIAMKLSGHELPAELPDELHPNKGQQAISV
ncbi:unnamed protein product [Vitrella brassicaformis CCMP3155]|uniref:Uncharacterized protein n=2 Tax=Vitrella brassicaformis TaxID=1169539 RepID=A0A0G4GPR5_VITBC|nr:unnamed protein product [Vitrella brassicaformis CCMP3155]|mmetsp:Transcript_36482/g.91238  ORF Transcript_36482/g.91238 Transcript_36482/m.91238 type:complete len:539 (+) Transcript_36482:1113-2729(+)|eukprot:CEM32347.1 unnamed protein product [Vitrella brassicaformis CCMP3155]